MKALRDLGVLLLVLLGMLWLGAEPQAAPSASENGSLTSAPWVLPPFPDALLEQKPVVQLLQQLPGLSAFGSSSQHPFAAGALIEQLCYRSKYRQLCLQGRLQLLHRIRLYPFHEFG